MTANLFEHTRAHWAKYSDYEWRTAPDGYDYLLPTADAKPSVYDPIQQADALVVEAVNIGEQHEKVCPNGGRDVGR